MPNWKSESIPKMKPSSSRSNFKMLDNQIAPNSPPLQRTWLRLWIVLIVAGFFAVCVYFHLFWVNSYHYYTWNWKWVPSITVYTLMLPMGIPLLIGLILYQRNPERYWLALGLICFSSLALMVVGALVENNPPSFSRISDIVESRWSSGYYGSAEALAAKHDTALEILRRYPALLPHFFIHPRCKPPGGLLYEFAIIKMFGPGTTATMVSGFSIGIFSALSVPLTFLFVRCFTGNRDAAFFGACYFALCPSLVLFFPDFDSCFPVFTCALTMLWALALRKNSMILAAVFGLVYAISAFFTYLHGVLPIFLVGFTLLEMRRNPSIRLMAIAKHLATSLVAFAGFYLILWLTTGFDPIATFRACMAQVKILWDIVINVYHYPHHSLPWTFFTDLYDFALGSGWIGFLIAGFYFRSALKQRGSANLGIAVVSVAQFVIIAAVGLMPTETARTWIFMYPMLILPIGLELAQWPQRARIAVYTALLLLTVAMCQSMEFMTSAY
jgi:hypothetical protein